MAILSRDTVLRTLSEHKDEILRLGVKSLAVFGSVCRDEATSESDIDVLVEFSGAGTYDSYMRLKGFLERLLGMNVDLVTRKALKPRMKQQVESEAVYVA